MFKALQRFKDYTQKSKIQTLGKVHDAHTAAGHHISQDIFSERVFGQPAENRNPGQKYVLQRWHRTPAVKMHNHLHQTRLMLAHY